MPLKRGKSNIGANIKELEEHGSRPRSHKQIVAIALNAAGQSNKPGSKLKKAFRPSPGRHMKRMNKMKSSAMKPDTNGDGY